jgi:hypothetical protein
VERIRELESPTITGTNEYIFVEWWRDTLYVLPKHRFLQEPTESQPRRRHSSYSG